MLRRATLIATLLAPVGANERRLLFASVPDTECTPAIPAGECLTMDSTGLVMACADELPPIGTPVYTALIVEEVPDPVGVTPQSFAAKVLLETISAHSRRPIMTFEFGGAACVKSGRLSVITQGVSEPMHYPAGACFALPQTAAVSLVNYNHNEDVVYFQYTLTPWDRALATDEWEAVTICEQGAGWEYGPLKCEECLEVFENACQLYGSCGSPNPSLNWEQPCYEDCLLNGAPPAMTSFDVPDGVSVNANRNIPMAPSWSVGGGHSGSLLDVAMHYDDVEQLEYVVERTTRLVGTRAVIHTHDWGGITCIQQGEMTLVLDNLPGSVTVREGGCYWMPPMRFMTGMNTGDETCLMWDMFALPISTNVPVGTTIQALSPKELFTETPEIVAAKMEVCQLNQAPYVPFSQHATPCECSILQDASTTVPFAECPP